QRQALVRSDQRPLREQGALRAGRGAHHQGTREGGVKMANRTWREGYVPGKAKKTIHLDDEVARALEIRAAEERVSQAEIVERALRKELGMMEKTYRVSDGVTSEIFEATSAEEALRRMFDGYDWGGATYTVPRPGEGRPAEECYTVWEVVAPGEEIEVLWGHLTEVGAPVAPEQDQ